MAEVQLRVRCVRVRSSAREARLSAPAKNAKQRVCQESRTPYARVSRSSRELHNRPKARGQEQGQPWEMFVKRSAEEGLTLRRQGDCQAVECSQPWGLNKTRIQRVLAPGEQTPSVSLLCLGGLSR